MKKGKLNMKNVTPFLMFQGGIAEEAMKYYTSLIEDSEIKSITRYGAEGPVKKVQLYKLYSR